MLIKTGFRNLWRNSRRTAAVILTVALGTGALLIMKGFNTGIMNQYREGTIHSRYGHGQVNTIGYRDKAYEKPWEHWIENYSEVEKTLHATPGVEFIFPRVEFFALLSNGQINVSGRGQGVDGPSESKFFDKLNVEEGKILSDEKEGVLLGRGLARSLNVHVGDRLTVLANTLEGSLNGVDLNVVGIFHTGKQEFDDVYFRIQLAQAQRLLDTNKVESIALGLKDLKDWDSVSKIIKQNFKNLEATPFSILDKIYYQNSVDWLNSQFFIFQIIILIVTVLGIFNTVSTMIHERKQEIGNLRANGESVMDLLKLLITEGFFMGLFGALFGVLIVLLLIYTVLSQGILMPPAPGLTRQFSIFIEIEPIMVLKPILLGILACLLSTLLAAVRVSRQPIGKLLRSV